MQPAVVFSLALVLAAQGQAGILPRAWTQHLACILPSWTISGLTITYSDDSFAPANVSFTLSSSATGKTENITCGAPFNYACRLNSTGTDKDLRLRLEFRPDGAYAWFNQTWKCVDEPSSLTTPTFAVGMADIAMICPEPPTESMTCTASGPASVNGTLAVAVPAEA